MQILCQLWWTAGYRELRTALTNKKTPQEGGQVDCDVLSNEMFAAIFNFHKAPSFYSTVWTWMFLLVREEMLKHYLW
jgi:hypothetical protein